jgi:hypothetical protein
VLKPQQGCSFVAGNPGTADVAGDEKLLDLALFHNLAVYDASYLSLASSRKLPLATMDGKLQAAALNVGMAVIKP